MSTKTSLKKKNASVMAGAVLAAILAVSAFSPTVALAQSDEAARAVDERPKVIGFTSGLGVGIATDTAGQDYRTAFKVVAKLKDDNSTATKEFEIKRGAIAVAVGGERIRSTMVPETWKVAVAQDGLTFTATGQVQDEQGKSYSVTLEGYFAKHTRLGNLWSIEGTMSGEGLSYELHYAALSQHARAVARGQ